MPYPTQPTEAPDTVSDDAPDTVSTPEGDNEFSADAPLVSIPAPERPRGNEPHPDQPIRPAQP